LLFYKLILLAAAKKFLASLSGPRKLAVAVSVAYVIRSTVEEFPEEIPPPKYPSVVLPAAENLYLAELSGPLTLEV
jgi:hypothetical protein